MDAKQFNKVVEDFAVVDVPAIVLSVQKQIALRGLASLVKRTPVDTGRARNNWQVGIDQEPPDVLYPAAQAFSGDKSGSPAVNKGTSKIRSLRPFCVCYLTNNVEYILDLENGSSAQAPNGMLSVTLHDLASMFR